MELLEVDKSTSSRMKKVGVRDTSIEIKVRSFLHKSGFRFSLKNDKIIGKPDIILPKYNTAIFVHGCFWHGCTKCKKGNLKPKKNSKYWLEKIHKNIIRDKKVKRILRKNNWNVITLWECQINSNKLKSLINKIYAK